jgi:hypothetical protein
MSDAESIGPEDAGSTGPEIVLTLGHDEEDAREPDFSEALRTSRALIQAKNYAAAAAALEQALREAGEPPEYGRNTCGVLLDLGICHFELARWDEAEQSFTHGLEIAVGRGDRALTGAFQHELSMLAWARGQQTTGLELARDALVSKLEHFIARATPRHAFDSQKRRNEPLPAIERLAMLLATLKQWPHAEILYVFLRDSCEARNDLPALTKALAQLVVLAMAGGNHELAQTYAQRAMWNGRMANIDVESELRLRGVASTVANEHGPSAFYSDAVSRNALEQSLIEQYRAIAAGLLADRIARGEDLSPRGWWHQYCCLRDPTDPYAEDLEDPQFTEFQNEIVTAVVTRRAARIRAADLMQRTVTINGAEIPFWQEGTINRHLAELGSSLRLFVAGTDVARAQKLLETLRRPVAGPSPAAFILGEVRPMTAIGKAVFFDFGREFALSPYINPDSPGLNDQGRVVMRQILLGHVLRSFASSPAPHFEELRRLTAEWCQQQGMTAEDVMGNGLLAHEIGHVEQFFPPGQPAGFSSWRAIVREDICRFAQTPRTYAEIHNAFRRTFEGLGGNLAMSFAAFLTFFPPGESPVEQPLPRILADLVGEGLLKLTDDRRYCIA